MKKLISVVAGCFNEEGNVDELVQRVRAVFNGLPQYRWEMIFIDNASTDGTAARLRALAAADDRVKVIFNARNFGHIRSPYHALTLARGDAVISLVSDLQDPPEMIPQFLAKWEEGFQAVVGVKESSEESSATTNSSTAWRTSRSSRTAPGSASMISASSSCAGNWTIPIRISAG
jgi:glycosyltransferase involved in cell wall biosynthesis